MTIAPPKQTVLTIVGARPQFVKAAALSRALSQSEFCREIIVHTGQHFDANMSDVFFDELQIPAPKWNLGIHGGTHAEMTGQMLPAIEKVMLSESPDLVLVYGDTNSTLAGALAASKLGIPIAHVEAGLRSFNRAMPEEINRVITDHLSSILFCPTATSVANLAREGITSGVSFVGDVMFDAVLFAKEQIQQKKIKVQTTEFAAGTYALATIHRAENTLSNKKLSEIVGYLVKVSENFEGVVWPMHPRTKDFLVNSSIDTTGITIIDPLGYFDFQTLVSECAVVFTDSGVLQKEAFFHSVPCVTLRDETEWVETIENGWNRLWSNPNYKERKPISDYGTGETSKKIVEIIEQYLK